MDLEDSLKCEDSEVMSSVIQNISALSMNMIHHEDESQNFVFPQSPNHSERVKNLDVHTAVQLKVPNFPDSGLEPSQDPQTDKKLKVIKVEVEFLKKSIDYLKSVLAQKSVKVSSKDEKIEKLDKVIEKQKKKLKDLKNRMKFQGCKLAQLEARIPEFFYKMEKGKNGGDGVGKQGLGKISIKKSKGLSNSPRGKQF
jgi:peptidoglycan hydrolase CwlO-like protein